MRETQEGVQGKVGKAVANLTMFTKESQDDVTQISYKTSQTQDKIWELEKAIKKQESQIGELKRSMQGAELKIKSNDQVNGDLRAQADAATLTDIGTREMNLSRQLYAREKTLSKMLED